MTETQLTRSERKRQAVLEAARAAFRENGVDGTSMDALAERAGVSKRTVYHHFPSKEALVGELASEMAERARQRLHVKYDPGRPLEIQLLTLVGAEIELNGDPDYLGLLRVIVGHHFFRPDSLRDDAWQLASHDPGLVRWIEAASADARLDVPDAVFAAGQLRGLVAGTCLWPQLMGLDEIPSRDEQRRRAEEAVTLFLARYGV